MVHNLFDSATLVFHIGVLGDDVGGERITEQDMENTSKDVAKGVRVTYSGIGTTADTYIEGRCFQAKNVTEGKLTGSLIVVTDDNLIRIAAVSAGAVLVGSERIVDELKVVRKAIMYKIESAIARETGVPMRHESLHGKHEEITFKMGKFKVVDKRNTTNTRQERWRKKTAEKRAARERMLNSISDEGKLDERKIIEVGAKLPSLQKKKQTKPEKSSEIEYIKKHTHVPSLQKQEQIKAKRSNNVVSIGTQKNMRSSANENGLLAGVVQKFEEFDVTSPKAILNEYYQVQHRVSINLKNQYITQSKSDGSSTIWNADFQCPITNQRFAAGLYGKGYTIDKKTHEVWFQTKAIAEHAAAHAALRQLLYS
jgi:predicted RNA-binding protein with PIN domain